MSAAAAAAGGKKKHKNKKRQPGPLSLLIDAFLHLTTAPPLLGSHLAAPRLRMQRLRTRRNDDDDDDDDNNERRR